MAGFVLTIATAWGCCFLSWYDHSGWVLKTYGVELASGGTWSLFSDVDWYWCRTLYRTFEPWPAAETFGGGVRSPSFETEELARRIADAKEFFDELVSPGTFSNRSWFWGDMLDPDNTKFDDYIVFRYGFPFSSLESLSSPRMILTVGQGFEPLGLNVTLLPQRNGRTLTLPVRPTRGLLLDTLFWGALCFAVVRTPGAVGRVRRRARGLCEHCGYAIAGLSSSTCPECGSPTTRNLRPASP